MEVSSKLDYEETPLEVENTTEEIDENTPILQNLENAL